MYTPHNRTCLRNTEAGRIKPETPGIFQGRWEISALFHLDMRLHPLLGSEKVLGSGRRLNLRGSLNLNRYVPLRSSPERRSTGERFFWPKIASKIPMTTSVTPFPVFTALNCDRPFREGQALPPLTCTLHENQYIFNITIDNRLSSRP